MDKNEKLALARKKLKKFQARNSPQTKKGGGGSLQTKSAGHTPSSSLAGTGAVLPGSLSSSQPKTTRLSSTEGLREISQEISDLLSESSLRQTAKPTAPPAATTSSSSLSSLPIALLAPPIAPPTQQSSSSSTLTAAPPTLMPGSSSSLVPPIVPPTQQSLIPGSSSLGTSAASSMSDLSVNHHHHLNHVIMNNDSPSMFKSGSAASSLGSTSVIPQAPFASSSYQAIYASGRNSIEQGHKENGYSLPTPSTIVDGGNHQDDNIAPPSASFLLSFGHQQLKDEKAMENDLRDVQVTPRPFSYGTTVAVNDVDMREEHASTENEVLGMGMGPSVDFQIGTPQYQRGSPVEGEGVSYGQDGHHLRHHNSSPGVQLLQQQAVVMAGTGSAVSEIERRELERKVQAHAQTIDILVSEKSKLQTELSRLQTELDSRKREWEDGRSHLKSTRQSLDELEQSRQLLSEELSHKQKALAQSQAETSKLRENVEKLRSLLEDQQEENTELISKITAQSAKISSVKNANVELQSKLGMAELLVQQLSGDSTSQATPTTADPALEEELTKVRGEAGQLKSRLQQVTSERDQANSDLSALRDAMMQQQEESTSKLADTQTKLAESTAQVAVLTEQLQDATREKEALLEKVSTEHAQFEHSNQAAMEGLQLERDDLQGQLQQRTKENEQLAKANSDLSERSLELEVELSRLQEQSIDHHSLLTTMAQDKETLSRAMSQNKELKTNVAELQDAFVRLSNQNMELASDLETERHHVAQLKRALAAGEQLSIPPPPPPASETSVTESRPGTGQTTPTTLQTTPTMPIVALGALSEDVGGGGERMEEEVGDEVKGEQEQARMKEQEEQIEALLSERSSLLSQLQALDAEHNQSLEEHHRVQEQLDQLSQTHQELLRATEEEEERRRETKRQEEIDFSTLEEDPTDVTQFSKEQLLQLQSNFRALQRKFISLMSEKAELLERIQEHEHVIVQLSVETETIGEYVALYQTQRESLKAKFVEKDLFIERLTSEKATIQGKLHELQILMKQLLSERADLASGSMRSRHHHPHSMAASRRRPMTLSTSGFPLTPTPPHSPTDIPIHMRPVASPQTMHAAAGRRTPLGLGVQNEHEISSSFSFTRLTIEDDRDETDGEIHSQGLTEHSFLVESTELGRGEKEKEEGEREEKGREKEEEREEEEGRVMGDGHVTSATAEQIMHLIGELEMTTSGLNKHVVPCTCCTGELVVV